MTKAFKSMDVGQDMRDVGWLISYWLGYGSPGLVLKVFVGFTFFLTNWFSYVF